MVVRRDFGSYRRADANGDSRAARVQYRLGRAAAVLARTVQYECHQRARVSFGRHVDGHGRDRGVFVRRDSGVLGAAEAPHTLSPDSICKCNTRLWVACLRH